MSRIFERQREQYWGILKDTDITRMKPEEVLQKFAQLMNTYINDKDIPKGEGEEDIKKFKTFKDIYFSNPDTWLYIMLCNEEAQKNNINPSVLISEDERFADHAIAVFTGIMETIRHA